MKKLIALLLALCMVFALCACGSTAEAPAAETPAAETPAEEAPAEEPGIEPVTLTIYSPAHEAPTEPIEMPPPPNFRGGPTR